MNSKFVTYQDDYAGFLKQSIKNEDYIAKALVERLLLPIADDNPASLKLLGKLGTEEFSFDASVGGTAVHVLQRGNEDDEADEEYDDVAENDGDEDDE